MTYCLGRLPATRPFGVAELSTYAKGRLPNPPRSVAAPHIPEWGMLGNDQYGNCTMAGAAHLVMAWNADLRTHDPVPSQSNVVETYFTLSGGADSGLNENNVLGYWRTNGLFGEKIAAYAPVDPRSVTELHQAVAFYRAAYLGIMCPQSAQEDFAAGRPWAYDPESPIEGGHCIVAVGYSPTALLCVSWGQLVEVTYPFIANLLEEAWAIIPNQMVERRGDGLGIDLASLTRDLGKLAA